MPRFKFTDFVFNQLFGYKFHNEDTYKDENGHGILQRFISICSEYFDDEITPDIKSLIDIIDIDETPEQYLPFIWEYLGKIPYAFGTLYNKNITYNIAEREIGTFSLVDSRKLLKYAISLYKIRCTSNFYTILGRFYGVDVQVTSESALEISDISNYSEELTKYNDISFYNQSSDCLQCMEIELTITIPTELMNQIYISGQSSTIKQTFINLFNKYLPIHVLELNDKTLIIK